MINKNNRKKHDLQKNVAANKMYVLVPVADVGFQLPNSSIQMLEYITTPIKFFNL
jgi:hypothetical protein